MKSILEFNNEQIEIDIPKWVVKESAWLDKHAHDDHKFYDKYEARYFELQDWYEKKASKLFGKKDIYMDGFFQHTDKMKEDNIIDYCKFLN